jgi:chemotaxis protein CheC
MDTANVLNGACLKGLAEQLDTHFSFGPPMLLGQHCNITDLVQSNSMRWNEALVVEINYSIENHRINCDLLLVIAEQSLAGLIEKLNYMLD